MTKDKIIIELKKEYPQLHKTINNEDIFLTNEEYEAKIDEWAEAKLNEIVVLNEAQTKRSAALAKLEALGLDEDDLKALGL